MCKHDDFFTTIEIDDNSDEIPDCLRELCLTATSQLQEFFLLNNPDILLLSYYLDVEQIECRITNEDGKIEIVPDFRYIDTYRTVQINTLHIILHVLLLNLIVTNK